jgi:hypothetical protein
MLKNEVSDQPKKLISAAWLHRVHQFHDTNQEILDSIEKMVLEYYNRRRGRSPPSPFSGQLQQRQQQQPRGSPSPSGPPQLHDDSTAEDIKISTLVQRTKMGKILIAWSTTKRQSLQRCTL